MTTTKNTADTELRSWLADWGAEVATQRFDDAEHRFDASVVGFGTKATVARGLEELRATQWSAVWPAIEDFAFDVECTIGCGWTSTGFNDDGSTFPRGGRATVVVRRIDGAWLGLHTHFSLEPLNPGTFLG